MNTEERRAWGRALKARRLDIGWTQQRLEVESGISRRTIGPMESGEQAAQEDTLAAIAKALGVDWPPQSSGLPADVENFLALLGPILARVPERERATLMPDLVTRAANAISGSAAS